MEPISFYRYCAIFEVDSLIMGMSLQCVKILTDIEKTDLFRLKKMWHILPSLSFNIHKNRIHAADMWKCSHVREKAETICQLYL